MSAPPEEGKRPSLLKNLRRRDAVILGGTLAVLAGGIGYVSVLRSHQRVFFVNALDVAVTVEVDGDRLSVESGGRVDRQLREGIHEVRVLAPSGEVIEEGPVDIPARQDAVTYNVLGAAPLYAAKIIYSSESSLGNNGGSAEFLGGTRVASAARADYVFTEPPQSIRVEGKSGGNVTKTAFDMAKGGWISTVNYLDGKQEIMKAAALCRAVARAEPGDEKAFGYARHFTETSEGLMGTVRFLRRERARTPDNMDAHLAYIGAMRTAGHAEEVRAEYLQRYQDNPGVPRNGVLLARTSAPEEARKIYDGLLQSHADDGFVREAAALFFFGMRDYDKSAELFAKIQDSPRYPYYFDDHARALVALGRVPEALTLASRFASQEATLNVQTALLYAQIARLPGVQSVPAPARAYLGKLAGRPGAAEIDPWASSLLGDLVTSSDLAKVSDEKMRDAIAIHLAAARDPRDAMEKCGAAIPPVFQRVHSTVAILVAMELARTGARAVAEQVLLAHPEHAVPSPALIDYVLSGAEHPDLWRLDQEWRAALDFIRARQLEAQGLPAEALYEAAKRGDLLHSVVSMAIAAWPRLGTSAPDKAGARGVKAGAAGKAAPASKAPAPEKSASSAPLVFRRDRAP